MAVERIIRKGIWHLQEVSLSSKPESDQMWALQGRNKPQQGFEVEWRGKETWEGQK